MQMTPIFEFQGHIESCMYLDWHPTQADIILSGGQDNTIKVWNLNQQFQQNTRLGVKPVYQVQTQNSVKKCEWCHDQDLMITSISTNENRVSIWHLKKPYLQQYIFKGQQLAQQIYTNGFSDLQWIAPGKQLLCSQGTSMMLYDLEYNEREEGFYNQEQINSIVRPYSRVQTTVCDFNINDEIALLSEPLGIEYSSDSQQFADRFLESLNKGVNLKTFFEPTAQP